MAKAQIRRMDHTGDSLVAEWDTEVEEEVKVAQDELTKFLDSCVKEYGSEPPVWVRRIGQKEYDMGGRDLDLSTVEEVIFQPMIRGG